MAPSFQTTPETSMATDCPDPETLRESLGLRPTSYSGSAGHPDQRPCPSWCWVERSDGELQHEIVARHPMKALHQIDSAIPTVASLYPGEATLGVGDPMVRAATLESDLSQLGSADPVVWST
jgi:hypothetical protein